LNHTIINRRDLDFLLFELLHVEQLTRHPRFAAHSRATFAAALDTALLIAEDKLAPCNRACDRDEPRSDGEHVYVIPEVGAALRAIIDAGFIAATFDEAQGGMQLPFCVALACYGIFRAANAAVDAYATLTVGAANLLRAVASPAQQARYLAPMLAGRYFGTMVLTEPHAGSSLADIQTSAQPRSDGTYALRGSKIFITAGDHELAQNIVHLVLARLPDAPPGTRGISLFIVPKYRVDETGARGRRNDVSLAGLIHKMGFRGTTSAILHFGENGDCIGELVGQEYRGLEYMFRMMNEARIGVGLGAAALGYTGYLHALAYARERVQGRADKEPLAPPVPIIRHADVRRMLLAQKAYVEGALALCLYAGLLIDRHEHAANPGERRETQLLLDLITPVVKAWPAQYCVEANSLAIQVHGGYSYTRDYEVEQFYRDNRLNAIHEGTNGIQALDLLGRKVFAADGMALHILGGEINETLAAGRSHSDRELLLHAVQLAAAWSELLETTRVIRAVMPHDPRLALANASVYLEMFGHTLIAWMWLRQALVARAGVDGPGADFYRGKLAAARYFFRWELPKTEPQHALLRSLEPTCLDMEEGWF
jgi:butyryl-CoA dehydrogenase